MARFRPGTLLVVMAYLGYVYGPMTAIASTAGSIQQALAGARRVRQTLSLPGERDGTAVLDRGSVSGRITFEHVSFGYDAPGTDAARRLVLGRPRVKWSPSSDHREPERRRSSAF